VDDGARVVFGTLNIQTALLWTTIVIRALNGSWLVNWALNCSLAILWTLNIPGCKQGASHPLELVILRTLHVLRVDRTLIGLAQVSLGFVA